MLTQSQITAILRWPGSYNFWVVTSPQGQPFWSHTRVGRVLHRVTATERKTQSEHTPSGPAMLFTESD